MKMMNTLLIEMQIMGLALTLYLEAMSSGMTQMALFMIVNGTVQMRDTVLSTVTIIQTGATQQMKHVVFVRGNLVMIQVHILKIAINHSISKDILKETNTFAYCVFRKTITAPLWNA